MRLDKFLKDSRIIIRRPVAKSICKQGRVKINHRVEKPGYQVHSNDLITIYFGNKILTVRIDQIIKNPKKVDASRMYTVISTKYQRDYHKEDQKLREE